MRRPTTILLILLVALIHTPSMRADDESSPAFKKVDYDIKLEKILCHDDGQWLWFHPRVASIPDPDGQPIVLMTLQKHLQHSDYYSGLAEMRCAMPSLEWTDPIAPRGLAWREEEGGDVVVGVCDVTPGWHSPTKKVLAIGVKVRYRDGQQLMDEPRCHETAYAVYDPTTEVWTDWRMVEMPHSDTKFFSVAPGCTQWHVEPDGSVLLPVYFHTSENPLDIVTVLRCGFDGKSLTYLEHGNEISIEVGRGAHEPSIARFGGSYYLTIRNDENGYVTRSQDGLHYEPIVPWRFDDGSELGSYNTQQHWLTHSDGLFLTYTRRGANNDHVFRHRAPLFIAQVDPHSLQVVRETERVLIPDRGAQMGNFGTTAIDETESWITVAEGMWGEARDRGAEGCVFAARVTWKTPNGLAVGGR